MYVADMHCDTAAGLLRGGSLINRYNFSSVFPQLQFAAVFTSAKKMKREERFKYTVELAKKIECERSSLGLELVTDRKSLSCAVSNNRSAVLLSIEGGGGLLADSPELDKLYDLGLRVFGPIWDTNEFGTSSYDTVDEGLKDDGVQMIKKCNEMGIIVDISHASDRSFWDIAEISDKPFVATHSNFRDVANNLRNLTRDMAMEIAERGGVVGLSLYPPHLSGCCRAHFSDIFRQVDYALENFGEDILAFGFDIDGTDGEYPIGITEEESIHDTVIRALLSRYERRIVEKICGANILAFLERVFG